MFSYHCKKCGQQLTKEPCAKGKKTSLGTWNCLACGKTKAVRKLNKKVGTHEIS